MNSVFADTSYYVALLRGTDLAHGRAIDLTRVFTGRVVTSQWILSELGNFFAQAHLRKSFVEFLADHTVDPDVLVVPAESKGFSAGAELYADRPDKSWSMVDCISFTIMRDHKIADAWTSDRHFTQAGFNALLL